MNARDVIEAEQSRHGQELLINERKDTMKYVTAMIVFGSGREYAMEREPHIIYANLTTVDYRGIVEHHASQTPTPIVVKPMGNPEFSFVPSECVAIHCGPERDTPET